MKVYSIVNLFIIYFYLRVTLSDPTDAQVYREREDIMKGDFKDYDPDLYPYECQYCFTHVSKKSKHCRQCDRCVSDFDHHCGYLNNCIGGSNYNEFFCLVIFVTLSGWMHISISCIIVKNINSIWYDLPKILSVILNALTTLGITSLLIYHIKLIWKGVNTFDEIMA